MLRGIGKGRTFVSLNNREDVRASTTFKKMNIYFDADYQKQLEKDRADYQKEEIMLTQMNAEEIDAQIRAERELEQSY